jgi:hypothetical protein
MVATIPLKGKLATIEMKILKKIRISIPGFNFIGTTRIAVA